MRKIILTIIIILSVSITTYADKKPKVGVGDVPPDYVGKTLDGEKVYLSEHKGKIVVVTFWASWCAPCRKELPIVNLMQSQVPNDEFLVVGVNMKEDKKTLKWLKKGLGETHMMLTLDKKGRISKKFGVKGIPHMFIVGPDGKVAAVHVGYSENSIMGISDEINDMLRSARVTRNLTENDVSTGR
jgi:thiol-disulfide isomerase/thioredoxin